MLGAEERRVRRMEQYAARRTSAADDALMVDQGGRFGVDIPKGIY